MSNQEKPPEFSELFLLFSCLVTSLLQAAGPQWGVGSSRVSCGMLWARNVVTGRVCVALSGAGLAWTLLSFLPELRGAADTSDSPCIPVQVPMACSHLCILHAGPERTGSSVRAQI